MYYFIGSDYDSVKTETVYLFTSQRTISTKIFAVRDEKYIGNDASGTIVPMINEGEKLAKGDIYAVVCDDAAAAAAYLEKKQILLDLERYERLNTSQTLNALDISKIDKEIDLSFYNLLDAVSAGDYTLLATAKDDFRDRLTSRQNAVNPQKNDFTQKISDLKNRLVEIDAQNINAKSFITDYSGYFAGSADGYETSFPFDSINSIQPAEIEDAVNGALYKAPPAVFGKVICSFNWYLLAAVDTAETAELKPGDEKRILIGRNGEDIVTVKVYSVTTGQSGKSSVVFECNQMNDKYAAMRIEDAKIILDEYKGYKIKNSAVRMVDNIQGVYILRGNVVGFRKLSIAESREDYIIADINAEEKNAEEPDGIQLYDEVIVEGKNLYEGKIVKR